MALALSRLTRHGGPTHRGGSSFAPGLKAILERVAGPDAPPVVEDPSGVWLYVDPDAAAPLPERGWKLHVSAINPSAMDVLERCVPLLIEDGTSFKVAASYDRLLDLNLGVGGEWQVGKFLTVYPRSVERAVPLAARLDELTRGLRGPRVRGDRSVDPTSLVHYRFGDFVPAPAPDRDNAPSEPEEDPFVAAGVARAPGPAIVAKRFLITGTLHRSIRGAVHIAVDLEEQASRILKRAGRDAWAMPDGTDARDRLRDEAALFTKLAGSRYFPRTWDPVEHEDDLFLPMEFIEGETLAERIHALHQAGSAMAPEDVVALGLELAAALDEIHSVGFVHRDLSPANVILRDGSVCLVDLELALPNGESFDSYVAGTERFMSPGQRAGAPAAVRDDIYGVGALLFFATTGTEPPEATDQIEQLLESEGKVIPDRLSRAIARCGDAGENILPSMRALRTMLEGT